LPSRHALEAPKVVYMLPKIKGVSIKTQKVYIYVPSCHALHAPEVYPAPLTMRRGILRASSAALRKRIEIVCSCLRRKQIGRINQGKRVRGHSLKKTHFRVRGLTQTDMNGHKSNLKYGRQMEMP
jgi:hypothetical protein